MTDPSQSADAVLVMHDDALPAWDGTLTASRTFYYPCTVCLSDGTVASTGACRGHKADESSPEPTAIELCPYCGK